IDTQALARAGGIVETARVLNDRRVPARANVIEYGGHAFANFTRRIPAAGIQRCERGAIAGIHKNHSERVRPAARKLCPAPASLCALFFAPAPRPKPLAKFAKSLPPNRAPATGRRRSVATGYSRMIGAKRFQWFVISLRRGARATRFFIVPQHPNVSRSALARRPYPRATGKVY